MTANIQNILLFELLLVQPKVIRNIYTCITINNIRAMLNIYQFYSIYRCFTKKIIIIWNWFWLTWLDNKT